MSRINAAGKVAGSGAAGRGCGETDKAFRQLINPFAECRLPVVDRPVVVWM